jgi:tetratricopeptide (TPR) repeat protein
MATVLLLATVIVGCSGKTEQHDEWVKDADSRWRAIKTAQALVMARQKFETGDLDLAERDTRVALSGDPDNAQLHMLLGQIELERGKLERSYQEFTTAILKDEKLARAYYLRGVILQRIHKIEKAYQDYAQAFELESDNPAYLLAIGEMLVSLDRSDEAIALLRSKLDHFSANAGLRLEIAHIYAMRNNFDEAITFFKEAALLDSDNPKPREELAAAQLADGRTLDAVRTFTLLLKESGMEDRMDLQRSLASAYMKLGRHNDARTYYLRVARSSEGRSDDWVMLGQMSLQSGKAFDAQYASRKAIETDSLNPDGYLLAGMIWQKREKLDEALEMFDRAAELSPNDAAPLIMRGISLQRAGRKAAASEAYRQAIQRSPQDKRAQQLLDALSRAGN